MRIFAASFQTKDSAVQALQALDRRFRANASIQIAPLGHAGGGDGPSMVLAGRVDDTVIGAVRDTVDALGGDVLVDVEERTGS